jgi:Lipocalin-like domain
MNHLKSFSLVAFCLLALTLSSCKKEIVAVQEVDIETQLLGRWKLTSVIIDGKESISTQLSSCDFDNAIVLETGGKGFSDFGTVKCSATEPQTKAFSWSWDDKAAKKFTINDGDKTKLTITELNSATMKADFVDAKSGQFIFTRL